MTSPINTSISPIYPATPSAVVEEVQKVVGVEEIQPTIKEETQLLSSTPSVTVTQPDDQQVILKETNESVVDADAIAEQRAAVQAEAQQSSNEPVRAQQLQTQVDEQKPLQGKEENKPKNSSAPRACGACIIN